MADPIYSEELDNIVNQMLSQSPHEQFKRYWELYKETAYISDPKGFYFRISQDAIYRNIVIAGDTGIVDIEADENSGNDRQISVAPYRSFSAVFLHMGSVPTLPSTQNALLIVACRVEPPNIGPYWSAYNEDEVKRLRSFAKILVKSVSL